MLATAAIVAVALTSAEFDFAVLLDRASTRVTPLGNPADATRCRIIAQGEFRVPQTHKYPDPAVPGAECVMAHFLDKLTVAIVKNDRVISSRIYPGPLRGREEWEADPVVTEFTPTDRLTLRLTLVGRRMVMQSGPAGVRKLEDVPVRLVKVISLPNPRAGR